MARVDVYSPKDFHLWAPPRIMGAEAEDSIRLRKYTSYARVDDIQRILQEERTLKQLMTRDTFQRAGIIAHESSEAYYTFWLLNGSKIYRDGAMLESSNAERVGPKDALARTLGGIKVVGTLADASTTPLLIFRRAGNYDPFKKEYNGMAFHINHLIPEQGIDDSMGTLVNQVLDTHFATRMYTWEGMVGQDGFLLSQKAQKLKSGSYDFLVINILMTNQDLAGWKTIALNKVHSGARLWRLQQLLFFCVSLNTQNVEIYANGLKNLRSLIHILQSLQCLVI